MTSRAAAFTVGDGVQTPLGKGVVREVRNGGRLLVDLRGRGVVMEAASVTALGPGRRSRSATPLTAGPTAPDSPASRGRSPRASAEVDLHGLTVEDALARAEEALNDALLADLPDLRLIHGRSGGRIRAALHRRLGEIRSLRGFRLDPGNPGVTIVTL